MSGVPPLAHPQPIDQLKGKFVVVHYDIPGETTWHSRLVLAHVTAGEWVILTPQGDIYTEDLGVGSLDIDSWRLFDPSGAPPFGINPHDIHAFNPVPDQGIIGRLLQEGEVYAAHEKLQRGIPLDAGQAVAAAAPAAIVPAAAPAAGALPNLAGGGAPAGGAAAAAAAAPAAAGAAGGVALAPQAAAIAVDPGIANMDVDSGDARTLIITRDAQGQRFKEFRAASLECREVTFSDWPVAGPRTILYVMARIVEHGGSPIAHSQAWRVACRFQPTDKPAQDHEMLCRILQTMVVYDQLDVANLASAELIVRGIQKIEEQHKNKLSAVGDSGESSLFYGSLGGSRTGTVIAPKLAEWIGSEMQKEAAISKERRKAREERALSRKNEKSEKKEDK